MIPSWNWHTGASCKSRMLHNSRNAVPKQTRYSHIWGDIGTMESDLWRRCSISKIILVAVLLLVLLCRVICKASPINCTISNDPLPILHEFYKPGDLVIGGVVSQVLFIYNQFIFNKEPTQTLASEPM